MSLGFTFKFDDEGGGGNPSSPGQQSSSAPAQQSNPTESSKDKDSGPVRKTKSAKDEEREVAKQIKENEKRLKESEDARDEKEQAAKDIAAFAGQLPIIGPAIQKGMQVFDTASRVITAIGKFTGMADGGSTPGSPFGGIAQAITNALANQGAGQVVKTAVGGAAQAAAATGGGDATQAALATTAGAAAPAAAAAIGPITAIAAPIGAFAASIALATGAVYAYYKVHKTAYEDMRDMTTRLAQINGVVAGLNAQADVNRLMREIRTGKRLEDELKDFAPVRNKAEDAYARLADTFREVVYRGLTPKLESVATILEKMAEFIEKNQTEIEAKLDLANKLLEALVPLEKIGDILKGWDAGMKQKEVSSKLIDLLIPMDDLKAGDAANDRGNKRADLRMEGLGKMPINFNDPAWGM